MTASERRRLTYRYERFRAPASGILEAAGMTFLLLIAVRHYQSGAIAKAIISSGASFGLVLGPWLVSRVQASQKPAAQAASLVALVGAGLFLLAAAVPVEWAFVACSTTAMACASVMIPLMTQVYRENYPDHERGTLFSRTVMIRIATAGVFSYFAGRALEHQLEEFRWLLVMFAFAFVFASWCLKRCPSRQLTHAQGTHPFRSLRFVAEDRLFRQTLISWMLLGFGNLMMVPLRVEYLANPEHGWTLHGAPLTATLIAVLTGVVPNAARLLLNPFWGWVFDRSNFFVLRIVLNLGFLLGILSFFLAESIPGLIVGAVFYGVSHAGGDVAWSLWVTKFAPPERVADYMSVHTFFTGVRGSIAPLVAFQAVTMLPIQALAWASATLILVGTLLLVPEVRHGRGRRHASALTEEVLD
jgi:MFS family permease